MTLQLYISDDLKIFLNTCFLFVLHVRACRAALDHKKRRLIN